MKDETKVSTWVALKMAMSDSKRELFCSFFGLRRSNAFSNLFAVWVMAFTLVSFTISLSFNQFFPQLTSSLGYAKQFSLLLCAPPFAFAAMYVSASSQPLDDNIL